jgi:rare lipoprotein A (peptidoglycan hydrolase)
LNPLGGIILVFIVAIWLSLTNQHQNITPMVSGVVDSSDPNHPKEVYFGSPTLGSLDDMLSDLGIRIYKEDKVQVFPDPSLHLGSQINIERALPVVVDDAGKVIIYRTWTTQIKDFLTEQNIVLGDKDKIDPESSTWLSSDTKISITRVAETELKEEESVAFTTVKKNDPNMDKGQTRVEQAGKNGTKVKTYLVRRENGVEVSRTLEKEEVTVEPQDKIIYVGTRVVVLGQGNATWYETPWGGLTAAHNSLPIGTMVRVTAVNSGRSVVVRINDRGIQSDAIIDLSSDAFAQIAPLGAGVIPVVLTKE